jgi:hypothetical protein
VAGLEMRLRLHCRTERAGAESVARRGVDKLIGASDVQAGGGLSLAAECAHGRFRCSQVLLPSGRITSPVLPSPAPPTSDGPP